MEERKRKKGQNKNKGVQFSKRGFLFLKRNIYMLYADEVDIRWGGQPPTPPTPSRSATVVVGSELMHFRGRCFPQRKERLAVVRDMCYIKTISMVDRPVDKELIT